MTNYFDFVDMWNEASGEMAGTGPSLYEVSVIAINRSGVNTYEIKDVECNFQEKRITLILKEI